MGKNKDKYAGGVEAPVMPPIAKVSLPPNAKRRRKKRPLPGA